MEYTILITDQQSVIVELCWTSAGYSELFAFCVSRLCAGCGHFRVTEYAGRAHGDSGLILSPAVAFHACRKLLHNLIKIGRGITGATLLE
jgi:hypothetical protein